MWSYKTIEITEVPNSTQFNATITFEAQGQPEVSVSTKLSSRAELEQAIRVTTARLNERSELITETRNGTFTLTPLPEPVQPTAKEIAQREYDEALALFNDLKAKAELDPTTFNFSRDNQRVIVQQKLQTLMALG